MAILVDPAVWPWRDQRWAHLVSDDSLDELHDFAERLGVRRFSFQGDHYDVPAHVRTRAIGLGAEPVDSRSLLRRLKAGGLRLGPSQRLPKWSIVHDGPLVAVSSVLGGEVGQRLELAVDGLDIEPHRMIVGDRADLSGVLLTTDELPPRPTTVGVSVHLSDPPDDHAAVELFVAPA
ncbi:MAG: DUF4031 domain-containing protein [Actinomycetota bacterium]